MKPLYQLLAGACLIAFSTPANAQYFPEHQWSHRFGDTGTDVPWSVAVYTYNNDVIVAGSFVGSIDLGGGALTSAGSSDIFVARFDSNGDHIWSQRFGSTGSDVARGVVLEGYPITDIVVTGSFEGTVNFGGSDLTSAGGSDAFTARFSPSGAHIWSVRSGDTANDIGRSVAAALGAVVVTGSKGDTQTSLSDVFVTRYDAGGTEAWTHVFGASSNDTGTSIRFTGTTVVVAGEFRDQVSFGGAPLTSAGATDIFLASYDGAGVHQWSQRFGGTLDDGGPILTGSNPLYCTGYFRGTANFGGANLNSAGGQDIFLAKFDAAGTHLWSKRFGSTGNDVGSAVSIGDVVAVTGQFENTVSFGSASLTSVGGSDIFLAIYNDAGTNLRDVRIGGPESDAGTAVTPYLVYWPQLAAQPGRGVSSLSGGYLLVMAGTFRNTVDFGGGPLISAGADDAFLVVYTETWLTPVGPPLSYDRLFISSFPNPFNPMTTISYTLPSEGPVSIAIFDVNGARVATLVRNENRAAGPHEVRWAGRTDDGVPAASGVYFAQVEHADARQSVRLVLLK